MKPRAALYANVRRATTALVPGLVIAMPALLWVARAVHRASYTALGRDQGIFQFVAWAWTHGQRGYADVRDVNGPLTPLVHMAMLALGGRDEHQFRVLDFSVSAAVFLLVGACLPGIGREPRARERAGARVIAARAGWALAACVALLGQYVLYKYWDLAQRESFFDWFLLSSLGVALVAARRLRVPERAKSGAKLVVLSAALGALTWFGKPTYVLFTFAQLLALLVDDIALPRSRRALLFAAGSVMGALSQIVALFYWADPRAFLRIYLVDVPAMYSFIWPRTPYEVITLLGWSRYEAAAVMTSTALLALIIRGSLPRRALAIALVPILGTVSVILQRKGFPYHFHPVTSGLTLAWLLVLAWMNERVARSSFLVRLLPLALGAILSLRVAWAAHLSPYADADWLLFRTQPEDREDRTYLDAFAQFDYFPWELRRAADYLRAHTTPNETVQMYGMDAYLLFLAERRTATPYIYTYDLNADAALAGSHLPAPEGLHPTEAQAETIRAIRDAHENDLVRKLDAAPPAAFVFIDEAPLLSWADAVYDFSEHCPSAYAWTIERYRPAAEFGAVKIWLRKSDVSDATGTEGSPPDPK